MNTAKAPVPALQSKAKRRKSSNPMVALELSGRCIITMQFAWKVKYIYLNIRRSHPIHVFVIELTEILLRQSPTSSWNMERLWALLSSSAVLE
jgi:hypothetical protein